jgi:SAM-dependent methyltransferase
MSRASADPWQFPSPNGSETAAIWTGAQFLVSGEPVRVLSFGAGASGWTEALTDLHEEAAGRDHFIDVASRAHALAQVKQAVRASPPVILEVGCSSGYFLEELRAAMPQARIVGADYTLGTLQKLGQRLHDIPLLHFDLTQCPLPDQCVDVVVLLNVLEHIEDDGAAIAQVHRILRRGGSAIIEVPAGSDLYDSYDRGLLHFRRYDMVDLEAKLHAAGLTPTERSHLGFALFPAFWLTKKLSRLRGRNADPGPQGGVVNSINLSKRAGILGRSLMRLEAALRSRLYLPFGVRCLVRAERL